MFERTARGKLLIDNRSVYAESLGAYYVYA